MARMPAEIVSTSGSDVLIFAFPAPFFLATDLTALLILRGRAAFPPISFFLSFFLLLLLFSLRRMVASKEGKGNKKVRKGEERRKERESNLERKFREQRRQRRDRPFKLCKWKNGGANRLSYANGKIEELGWLVVPLKGGRVL